MRLSTKLSIVVLGGALIAIIVATVFSFFYTKEILQKSIADNHLAIAEQTIDKIDRVLYERLLDIQTVAHEETFVNYLISKGNRTVVDRRLNEFSTLTGPWDVIYLIEKNGTIAASTTKTRIGEHIKNEQKSNVAYERALNGEVYYSDVIISEDIGKPSIIYAAPVKDEDDPAKPIIGAVVGYFSWPVIVEILESADYQDAEMTLFNKDGLLIASSKYEKNTGEYILKKRGKSSSFVSSSTAGFTEEETLASISMQEGYLNFKGNNWGISFEQPTSIAFAPVYQNALQSGFIIGLTILIVAIFILYIINRSVTKPILALATTAQAITAGDFSKRVPILSKDEIGVLGVNFNQMTDSLLHAKEVAEKSEKELTGKVTELEEARAATVSLLEDLNEEKAKDEAILEGIGDGVFAIDTTGKIMMFNKSASEICGYTVEEAMGKPYQQILRFSLEGKTEIKDDFIRKALGGQKAEMANHTVILKKDGTTSPVADSAAPILNQEGKVTGVVVVFRDVTQEREVEKLKDEFVSIASHELRTPLSAIDGLVSMVLDGEYGPVGENLRQPLEDVTTSSSRLIKLVNDMLNLSRINAGRMKYTLSDFSIGDVITETVQLLQPVLKGRDITLTADKIDSIDVQGDIDKVKQVLNNLIGNSLKFTDKGTIVVSVKTVGDSVEVRVADSGIGIAEEDQSKLFGQFQQLDSGKGRPAGTGLGLHISRDVIRKLGGELWIDKSEKGVGTTFAFSLPKSQSSLALKVKKEIDKETNSV